MKNCFKVAAVASLLAGSGVVNAEVSGNVAMATDYMFRGVSQTDNQMALQGGFDWSHASGVYVGTWASNVAPAFFSGSGNDPQLEVDVYAGYAGEAGAISYDVGVLRYNYTGYGDADTTEIYFGGSYGFGDSASVGVTFYYSPELNFIGVDDSAWYTDISGEYSYQSFTFAAHIGFSSGDAYDNATYTTGYMDYSIGASTEAVGLGFDLSYIGTDNDGEKNFGGVADDRIVFTVSKSM